MDTPIHCWYRTKMQRELRVMNLTCLFIMTLLLLFSERRRSWRGKLNIDIGLLLLVYGFENDDYKYPECYIEAPQGCHGTTATFNYSVSFQSTIILRPHLSHAISSMSCRTSLSSHANWPTPFHTSSLTSFHENMSSPHHYPVTLSSRYTNPLTPSQHRSNPSAAFFSSNPY